MNEEDEISAINSPDSRRGNISDQRRSKSAGCDDDDDQPPGLANAGRESAVEFGYVRGTGGRPVRPTRSPDRETSPVPPKAQFGRRLICLFGIYFVFVFGGFIVYLCHIIYISHHLLQCCIIQGGMARFNTDGSYIYSIGALLPTH